MLPKCPSTYHKLLRLAVFDCRPLPRVRASLGVQPPIGPCSYTGIGHVPTGPGRSAVAARRVTSRQINAYPAGLLTKTPATLAQGCSSGVNWGPMRIPHTTPCRLSPESAKAGSSFYQSASHLRFHRRSARRRNRCPPRHGAKPLKKTAVAQCRQHAPQSRRAPPRLATGPGDFLTRDCRESGNGSGEVKAMVYPVRKTSMPQLPMSARLRKRYSARTALVHFCKAIYYHQVSKGWINHSFL